MVEGKMLTGFSNAEEEYSNLFVGKHAQMVIEALGGLNGRIGEHLRSLSR
jgi:hypothetical protein